MISEESLTPGQFLKHKLLGKMLFLRQNGKSLEVRRPDGTLMIAYPCEFDIYQSDLRELAESTIRLARIAIKEAEALDAKE